MSTSCQLYITITITIHFHFLYRRQCRQSQVFYLLDIILRPNFIMTIATVHEIILRYHVSYHHMGWCLMLTTVPCFIRGSGLVGHPYTPNPTAYKLYPTPQTFQPQAIP